MSFYIGIEDLAANALIEILSNSKDVRFVTYEQLEKYGSEVIRLLNQKGDEAVLILSRDRTNDMFRSYSNFFEEVDSENGLGIQLKDGITCNDLINQFRGYLALDVLFAFIDDQSVSILNECI